MKPANCVAMSELPVSASGTPELSAADTAACEQLLSQVPSSLTSLNTGLATIQFYSLSINPRRPTRELLGGTQDNGTFLFEGSTDLWPQTIGGDGGQSGFNAANPDIRFHTYFIQQVDVNFQGRNTLGWDWISDFGDPIAEREYATLAGSVEEPHVSGVELRLTSA